MENVKPVTQEITINASPDRVWETITNPELTTQYMYNCKVETNWKTGNELNWRDASTGKLMVIGNIIEIEPGKKLVYTTFDPNGKLEDKPENYSRVTYEISGKNGNTVLTVTQENYPTGHSPEDMASGWEYALEGLKKTAEDL
ncbi:MAG: hypothetical protein EHM58_13395 [Ignavibacteriae bacterium]|nr:MAG: hypothetical protein EHM58_13395 [Ignavibacteriota bacterium]